MPLQNGEYKAKVNGIAHWYRIAGAQNQTVPIVVVHGGPGGFVYNFEFERTIGPELETFTTLIYYEQRGSGRSDPPPSRGDYSLDLLISDLKALRQHWGLNKMTLLGSSFGAELALEYALRYSPFVEKLIIQAPSEMYSEPQSWVQLYGFWSVAGKAIREHIRKVLASSDPPKDKLEQIWELVDTPTADRFLFQNAKAAQLNRDLWNCSGLTNTGDMHRALTAQPREPLLLRAELAGLSIPTLLLVGLYDRNVGVDHVRDLAESLPNARLEVFTESAHFPDIEEPGKYVEVVRRFIAESGLR